MKDPQACRSARAWGSFTFVVAGSTVTSVAYDCSDSASFGGTSCKATTRCPASSTCATPEVGTISGTQLHISSGSGAFEATGTFASPTSAGGDVTCVFDFGDSSYCNGGRETTWTATKS